MDGPQIKALAHRLNQLLFNQLVVRIDVPADRWQANVLLKHCAGQHIRRVYSHGRWLLWNFSHGISWACYPLRRWRWSIEFLETNFGSGPSLLRSVGMAGTPPGSPSAVIVPPSVSPLLLAPGRRPLLRMTLTDGRRICLSGRPLFLILLTEGLPRHPELSSMGPDILADQFSKTQWVYRLRHEGGKTISQVLLEQNVAAGIGNQTKCEILFAARVHPSTHITTLSREELDHLANVAVDLMMAQFRAALSPIAAPPVPRRVFDRAGESCDVCATPIAVDRSGCDNHWSWYCPNCQPAREEPMLFTSDHTQSPAQEHSDEGGINLAPGKIEQDF